MAETINSSYSSVTASQKLYIIDIRKCFNYFEQPEKAKVGAAVQAIFPSDPALGLTPMTGRMAGCYRVAATTEPTATFITLARKSKKDCAGGLEVAELPLQPYSSAGGERRKGTLITIVDGDLGDARAIAGSAFDAAMGYFGEVVMNTKPQLDKETGLKNMNRMCVVDTENAGTPLPDRVKVGEKSFLIKYKGKKWHCTACATDHVGACPYLVDFYKALDLKKSIKIQHYVFLLCTFRHADHVGLKADVMCMPGATIGQMATALKDVNDADINEITIVAGANDIKPREIESELILAKQIDKSLERLESIVNEKKDSVNFVIMNSAPPIGDDSLIERFGKLYLKERLMK